MVVSGTCNHEVTFRHLLEAFEGEGFCASVISLNSKAFNSVE